MDLLKINQGSFGSPHFPNTPSINNTSEVKTPEEKIPLHRLSQELSWRDVNQHVTFDQANK